jgi:hypothetical protein
MRLAKDQELKPTPMAMEFEAYRAHGGRRHHFDEDR